MAVVQPWRPEGGAYAQHVVVPASSVVRIPEEVSFEQASTLPMNGLTALLALELAALEKDQVLAVSGGAGLLARYATAMGRRLGIRVVADAAPTDKALVASYGASTVVERGPNFAEVVRREVPDGADALLDTANLGTRAFGAVRNGGVYIPVRGWGDDPSERDIRIRPVWAHTVFERTDWLEQLRELASTKPFNLVVAREYTPEQAADAQEALAAGGLRGRPVITF